MSNDSPHRPVLLEEVLRFLVWREGGTYLDATVGAGGHAEGILIRDPTARVVGFDADAAAITIACRRLERFGDRFQVFHSNFADMASFLKDHNLDWVDGVMADLGVSSMQIETAERGFSFMQEGPLDMRMDPRRGTTAADVVNGLSEKALADLIYRFGEERYSRRIARAIVARRPISTTTQLAGLVARCYPRGGRHSIHPATRTFQALRIFVNGELESLSRFLHDVPSWLAPGGRAVIISFHSLEDRLVKQAFRDWERQALARVLTKHVVTAGETERRSNPRSRSAKLRAAEKINRRSKVEFEK